MPKSEYNTHWLWSLVDVARRLDVNPETLRKRARSGEITFVKVFGSYRFSFRDIVAMIGHDEATELFPKRSLDAGGADRGTV